MLPARTIFAISIALSTLAGPPATAAEFTLMIHEPPSELALRNDASPRGQAYWDDYAAAGKLLETAGVLRGGAALGSPDGASLASTQASAEESTGTRLGGYFVIDVADMSAALAWARRIPAVSRGGRVDVYPAWPAPAMR